MVVKEKSIESLELRFETFYCARVKERKRSWMHGSERRKKSFGCHVCGSLFLLSLTV